MKQRLFTQLRDTLIRWSPFYAPRVGKRILCFHDIQDANQFEQRMVWLKENFKIVSLSELMEIKSVRSTVVAITFDDGYESWLTKVLPVLKKLKLPATFFVNSNLLDLEGEKADRFFKEKCNRQPAGLKPLTTKYLQEIASDHLFDIGGHTADHYRFSSNTPLSIIEEQIIDDKKALEQRIGQSVQFFAYPFGQLVHATTTVQQVVQEAGYRYALTIVPGEVDETKNSYLLPRDSLELFQSEALWHRWLHGGYDALVRLKLKAYRILGIGYQ